jgi:phosphomethylpyrimidine synthase
MSKITRAKDLMIPKVTTGPISASTKVYTSPEGQADVRVPFREIALRGGEKSFRVYDPPAPPARDDRRRKTCRARSLGAERGSVENMSARRRPEDNGAFRASTSRAILTSRPCGPARQPVTDHSSRRRHRHQDDLRRAPRGRPGRLTAKAA